ncbi:hypothetical protein PYCCODRAFT_981922 [Trametes coccinea BRFM310]|uniref:Uncharacterized protein n=1 Tax=Trametes coccinea (strain BRFM310) TaxID=1353009 RepID=A0A1Y2IBH2_TRAC3|nr:hypothetical protein PYCCODRAFT_981922 [Trametes coccinea BRFM310]
MSIALREVSVVRAHRVAVHAVLNADNCEATIGSLLTVPARSNRAIQFLQLFIRQAAVIDQDSSAFCADPLCPPDTKSLQVAAAQALESRALVPLSRGSRPSHATRRIRIVCTCGCEHRHNRRTIKQWRNAQRPSVRRRLREQIKGGISGGIATTAPVSTTPPAIVRTTTMSNFTAMSSESKCILLRVFSPDLEGMTALQRLISSLDEENAVALERGYELDDSASSTTLSSPQTSVGVITPPTTPAHLHRSQRWCCRHRTLRI